MSTLAAACADGFYQPPDWDPAAESRNTFQARGKAKWQGHPLRERAKKLESDGVLVTRFEIPFDIWCAGCGNHIAKGVRFNADKKEAGRYLSSKIWSFRMKCHLCPCVIELRTNPRAGDYDVVEGARRKEERYTEEAAEVERLDTPAERARRTADPFHALEHRRTTQQRAQSTGHWLTNLRGSRDERWGDDYELSSLLRKRHRVERQESRQTVLELRARGIGIVDHLPALSMAEEQLARERGGSGADAAKRRKSAAAVLMPEARLRMGGIFDGAPGQAGRAAELEKRLQLLHKRTSLGMKISTQQPPGPGRG
jgi:coiled-coil domain-containing protein 130